MAGGAPSAWGSLGRCGPPSPSTVIHGLSTGVGGRLTASAEETEPAQEGDPEGDSKKAPKVLGPDHV